MPKYRFRRELYVNDPDPIIRTAEEERKAHEWAFAIDGQTVTKIDSAGQWWVGPYQVQKDWCEKVPEVHLV